MKKKLLCMTTGGFLLLELVVALSVLFMGSFLLLRQYAAMVRCYHEARLLTLAASHARSFFDNTSGSALVDTQENFSTSSSTISVTPIIKTASTSLCILPLQVHTVTLSSAILGEKASKVSFVACLAKGSI